MTNTDRSQSPEKPSWLASHMEVVVVIAVSLLIVLPLAFLVHPRITVTTFISSAEPPYPVYVEVFIDGELVGHIEINSERHHESFSVSVGQHEVVVQHGWIVEYQRTLIAWPFVGADVHCTLDW